MKINGVSRGFALGADMVGRRTYHPEKHLVTGIYTSRGENILQNLTYRYDGFSNLEARIDNKRNLEETFAYDHLNRLTGIWLGTTKSGWTDYDAYGRMTRKVADNLPVFSNAVYDETTKPHAIDRADTYNGVFTEQSVTYTCFDKVKTVTQGSNTMEYAYGYDRQRIFMEEHTGYGDRTKRYVGNCELLTETTTDGTDVRWLTCLVGPMGAFAMVETNGRGSNTLHYILKDNLGSWSVVTDKHGNIEQELSFDAWGNLRNPETWRTWSGMPEPMFDRGFTGHEHLYAFGLINMNGRMYDPVMSSFLSVDAFVDDPTSAQGFNRYAYCMHNPLRYTDPGGWRKQGREPSSGNYEHWSMRYAVPVYEPRDYQNPYYLYNQAFFGNYEGKMCEGGGSFGSGGAASYGSESSYGYYVTHLTNGLYNYCFASTQLQLILNWKNNPCRTTSNEVEEAGIGYVSVGLTQFGNGRQSSYITWTDASGTTRYAETHNEYIGGRGLGSYCFSFQPQGKSNDSDRLDANNISPTFRYLSVPNAVPVLGGQATMVQSAAYLTGGEVFSTIGKTAGKISGVISVGTTTVSTINRIQYLKYGGENKVGVATVGITDIVFTAAGFIWPWGHNCKCCIFLNRNDY